MKQNKLLAGMLLLAWLLGACAAPPGSTVQTAFPSRAPSETPLPPAPTATHTALPALTQPPAPTATKSTPLVSSAADRLGCLPPGSVIEIGQVTRVIDGDTIEVFLDGQVYTVRYIGIDTPEIKHPEVGIEPFGPEAAAYNERLVLGKQIALVKDVSEVDQYGRLLRYVFVRSLDGQFVNAELLQQGLAQANQYPPDVACSQTLQAAEEQARAAQLGLWAPAPASRAGLSGKVEIVTIFFNGSGEKEPDEYVEIRNTALAPIQLEGWTLVDKAKHRFTFPDFLLQPGQVCRIYTDQVHPEWCGFSFAYNETAIWNNGGDCATLADSQGAPVTEYCYSK